MDSSSMTKETTEAKHVPEISLWEGPERSLYEVLKVKSGFYWSPQDVEDVRVMGYLATEAANREWNQAKRKKCVQLTKLRRV